MAEDRWNDGRQYGLPAIGLPQADLATPGSDTERRSFPGLATKSSVFAWIGGVSPPVLYAHDAVAPPIGPITINFRRNTATGGSSVDVPTWAAGAVLGFWTYVNQMGAGVLSHTFILENSVNSVGVVTSHAAAALDDSRQLIMPFYDEPVMTFQAFNNAGSGLGLTGTTIYLIGFVRNV